MVLKVLEKYLRGMGKVKTSAIFLLTVIFCFINVNVYTEYLFPDASAFIIYRISEDAKNDIELIEYHINRVDDKGYYSIDGRDLINYPYDGYFQEYTLYNNGNVSYKVRLGVIYQMSSIPSELFRINGVKTPHQLGEILGGYDFAFIDVVFPPRKSTQIRVNDLAYISAEYDEEKGGWTDFIFFNGTPRFTATIGNYHLDNDHRDFEIEGRWINDIEFYNPESRRIDSVTSILEEKGSLSNDLLNIRKINGNTWEIEFTGQFVSEHRSNLMFDFKSGYWGIEDHQNTFGGSGFLFFSEKKLTPYQYFFLTNKQLQVVRNAYYARHGYIFKNQALKKMYEGFYDPGFGNINYRENPNFNENMLTDTDRANIETIKKLEALAGN